MLSLSEIEHFDSHVELLVLLRLIGLSSASPHETERPPEYNAGCRLTLRRRGRCRIVDLGTYNTAATISAVIIAQYDVNAAAQDINYLET